jgi:cellulose synthase operon protein C
VSAQPASIALFDHAIVYIPKYDSWLDGTAEYSVHELPLEDQGALALTVGLDGTAQLRHIPMSRASDNFTKHTIHAQLTPKGVILFSGSTAARGEDAPGLRQELAAREQQLESLRRDLAQVFPTIQVYSVDVQDQKWADGDLGEGDVSVAFRGDLDSFKQKRIVSLGSSWLPRSYVKALASSGSRREDLMLFAPWTTEEEIHITLPSGARVTQLPRDKAINTRFGSLRLHYRKSSDEVLVQSHVQFDKSRVAAADYPAFQDFCTQLERSFAEDIKVELAP